MRTSIWRKGEFLTLVALAALVIVGGSPGSAHAQGAGPTVIAQSALPVTVNGGEYALVQVILEFAPRAGIPRHAHGGPVVATVLAGEITLQESASNRGCPTPRLIGGARCSRCPSAFCCRRPRKQRRCSPSSACCAGARCLAVTLRTKREGA
jgi:hypothetical protein